MVEVLYNKENELYFKFGNWYVDINVLSKLDSNKRNYFIHSHC